MSRRHNGRSRQHDRPRPDGPSAGGPSNARAVDVEQPAPSPVPARAAAESADSITSRSIKGVKPAPAEPPAVTAPPAPPAAAPRVGAVPESVAPVPVVPLNGPAQVGHLLASPATAPQLRRFIKSRPYVPIHELRRRFAIEGDDDDVTPVHIDRHWIFVGLPAREGGLLGELLRAGEIGFELSLDPRTPIVVGVYPMRPASRG